MEKKSTSLMHNFTGDGGGIGKLVVVFVVIVVLGVGTGYLLAKNKSVSPLTSILTGGGSNNSVASGKAYGSNDTSTFKDTADGTLKEGGIDGEGQYHLERPGGDSQNVYVTSSTVDLSQFLNRKIKVWGQTQSAKKAGWLMDVGRVQVE